jgi:hypothetical protein
MTKFLKSFFIALIGSVAANLIVLFALRPFVINPAMPLHSLAIGPVGVLTAMGVVGATVVYALMRSLMTRPNKPFIWISIIVLIASFVPDFLIIGNTTGPFAGATISSALVLMLMHVVAAVIVIWALTTKWGEKRKMEVVRIMTS